MAENNQSNQALAAHRKLRGKISMSLKAPLDDPDQLSLYYTPGVGAVSTYLADNPEETRNYTWTNNSVAIVTDGSAVLGLGNIGPQAALPVMEGKSMLFKQFADIDAVPLVLNTQDPDEIIRIVEAIAPSFGGINLEDIKAPECFYIEDELKKRLNIPVFHDDQHGTAVVVLAGLINAARVTDRELSLAKVVIIGAGAAGNAITKLLHKYGVGELVVLDSKGAIYEGRTELDEDKVELAKISNPDKKQGGLDELTDDVDIIIGVSQPGMINASHIRKMSANPIVFALANPEPEIMPEEAHAAGVAILATGRSDFPNQVNNALAFPGIFRGALNNQLSTITDGHKIAAAQAIADLIESPTSEQVIPSILDPRLVPAIAAVMK